MVRHGVALIDVATPIEAFDFSAADQWFVVVLLGGTPVVVVETPSPGEVDSADLAEALFARRADSARWRETFLDHMRRRIGGTSRPNPAPLAVTVVVCTHRPPAGRLQRCLDRLAALDPAPAQVVIVDNDPAEHDCEALVSEYGFTYVREDRRGLDNARNAGIRVATGEVVALTDDDVAVPSAWLDAVPECFSHPAVGASTGPVFPGALETPAQVRMERQASLGRGIRKRVVDWTSLSAAQAGAMGAGANMVVRRSLLGAQPFPPDLDVGTESASGGDTYLLARILGAGHRIVYEPRQFVFHDHRREWKSARSTLVGYGKGITAVSLKLGIQAGEAEAPAAWWWLVRQYLHAQARRMRGVGDALDVRVASLYLLGGMLGFPGAVRARRSQRRAGADLELEQIPLPGPGPRPAAGGVSAGSSGVAVIVPTVERPAQLRRCLEALADQTGIDRIRMEVIVVDDAPAPTVDERAFPAGLNTRVLRTHGAGAAVARNRGAAAAKEDVLLFLDDDLVPSPTLVARHSAEHDGRDDTMVIGPSAPSPRYERSSVLAASSVALWWHDHFRELASTPSLTFSQALSGNMSIRRATFERIGSFSESYGRYRREDWEFGLRALQHDVQIRYVDDALAVHEYELPQGVRFELASLEGQGDGLLLERYPEAIVALKAREARSALLRARARAAPFLLPLLRQALPVLERLRLRRRWLRTQNFGQRLAYLRGVWRSGAQIPSKAHEPRLELEVADDDPLAAPGAVAPVLDIHAGGERIARFLVPDGYWGPGLWTRLADRLRWDQWQAIAAALGLEAPADDPLLAHLTVVQGSSPASQDALAAAGAVVVRREHVVPGWRASTPLVAYAVTDVELDAQQLAELAVAFKGEGVGVALGKVLPKRSPAGPLTLHRRTVVPVWPVADVVMVRADDVPAPERSEPGVAFATRVAHEAGAAGRLIATRELRGDGSSPEEAGDRWDTASAKGGRARAAYLLRSARTLAWTDRLRVGAWLAKNAAGLARRRARRVLPARGEILTTD